MLTIIFTFPQRIRHGIKMIAFLFGPEDWECREKKQTNIVYAIFCR